MDEISFLQLFMFQQQVNMKTQQLLFDLATKIDPQLGDPALVGALEALIGENQKLLNYYGEVAKMHSKPKGLLEP